MAAKIFNSTSDQEWDNFISESPHGSIFSCSTFANALEVPQEKLFLELDGNVAAAALILEPNTPTPRAVFPYQGIALAPSRGRGHSAIAQTLKVTEALCACLSERYASFNLRQHFAFNDMRGFQWFNYHDPELGQFKIDLQYTAIIHFEQYATFEEYLATIRSSRRQDAKKIAKHNLLIEESRDTEEFLRLYDLTLGRQNLEVDAGSLTLIRHVIDATLSAGLGRLVFCKDATGTARAAIVTMHDDRCSYYMFAATDPDFRSSGANTALLLHSIEYSYRSGRPLFDMVGVNSPQRGDFKTSFNAVPVPYYSSSFSR